MTIDKVLGQQADIEMPTGSPSTTISYDQSPGWVSDFAGFRGFVPRRAALSNSHWQIRCEDCDPQVGGYYWFSLNQCDTPAKALDCIMRLNEERCSPMVMQSFIDFTECLFGRGELIEE
jgi:hypothetical protein